MRATKKMRMRIRLRMTMRLRRNYRAQHVNACSSSCSLLPSLTRGGDVHSFHHYHAEVLDQRSVLATGTSMRDYRKDK
jgi:hypothetical protein